MIKLTDTNGNTIVERVNGEETLSDFSRVKAITASIRGTFFSKKVHLTNLTSIPILNINAGVASAKTSKNTVLSRGFMDSCVEDVAFPSLVSVVTPSGSSGVSGTHYMDRTGGFSFGCFYQTFFDCKQLIRVSFDLLETINCGNGGNAFSSGEGDGGNSYGGFYQAFFNCTSLQEINFPSLKNVNYGKGGNGIGHAGGGGDSYGGFYQAFSGCTSLQEVNFTALTSIGSGSGGSSVSYNGGDSYGGFYQAFSGCTSLQEVNFTALTSISGGNAGEGGNYNGDSYGGFYQAFSGCTSLQEVNFPALTSISGGSVGTVYKPFQDAFKNCSNVVVHFKSSMKGNSYLTVSNLGLSNSEQLKFDL